MRPNRSGLLICCIAILRLEGNVPLVVCAEEAGPSRLEEAAMVVPTGVPKTAFADSELRLRFACHDQATLAWQASAARRPFASGVVTAKGGQAEIRLHTPHVKEGVALPIQVAAGDAVCKILVFGTDPLDGRSQWAEQLQIVLFDPSGKTAKAFDEIDLPYRRATGLGALAAVTNGIIVVGEGVPLDQHRGSDTVLCQLARQGVPVILLAPDSGEFTVTDPALQRFELRRDAVGQRVDSRTAADLKRSGGFRVFGGQDGPVLRVTDQPSDYAWGDFRYDDSHGRLCCVTWNLLDQWETSPAPRFFFVRLLEIVSSGKDLPGGKTDD